MDANSEKIQFSIIPTNDLNDIKEDISMIRLLLSQKSELEDKSRWLPKREGPKILHVCQKTFDNYLKRGVIPYSRFGGKIMIKATDLEQHLQKHYMKKPNS